MPSVHEGHQQYSRTQKGKSFRQGFGQEGDRMPIDLFIIIGSVLVIALVSVVVDLVRSIKPKDKHLQ